MILAGSDRIIHHRVMIFLDEKEDIKELASLGLALESGDYRPGVYIVGEFSESELESIAEAGFRYEILIEDMTRYYQERNEGLDADSIMRSWRDSDRVHHRYETPENFKLGSMGGFHTYSELLDELDEMADKFPHLIMEKKPISDTLLSIEDRPVYWTRISNDPENLLDKPRVLYTALMHAREPASMQQMLFQMWYLLENYDSDPEIQYLVDNMEMYFVPCINPDGYIHNELTNPNGGGMHRKNMRIHNENPPGIDINRNYGYMWGYDNQGSSPDPGAQTYRGTGPFSEPETELQRIFAEELNFKLALNNHTFSDLLIYPWGYEDLLTPDSLIFINYADLMTRENKYVYGTVYETLNYFVNGGSDDWFYGEQETKDKVFAFTPEAGSQADGFWPAIYRIEEICAGHVGMNTYLARLALAYAEINQTCDYYIEEHDSSFNFELKNYGLDPEASFEVYLEPLSCNIIEAGEAASFANMEVLEKSEGVIDFKVHPSTIPGEEVEFVVHLDNGKFAWTDTVMKYFGTPEVVFYDPCIDMSNWTSAVWGITNKVYFEPPSSIADSPGSNYPANAHTTITTKQTIDLTQESTMINAEFYARWHIVRNYAYVQFMVSDDNGQTWTPLEGNYTIRGSSDKNRNEPLYDGFQDEWVKEIIDLTDFTGKEILLRFSLVSSHTGWWPLPPATEEGFYFDEFSVLRIDSPDIAWFDFPEEMSFYQHETLIVDLQDYTEKTIEDDHKISWFDNEKLVIDEEDGVLYITIDEMTWFGEENIVIMVEMEENSVIKGNLKVICEEIPKPVIVGHDDLEFDMNTHFVLEMDYLHVEDPVFNYPEDFEMTIYEGDNYDFDNHTIYPHEGFVGDIFVPVSVSNGYKESDLYDVVIEIKYVTTVFSEEFSFYQYETLAVDLQDYTEETIKEDHVITWSGNENLVIEEENGVLYITVDDLSWAGEENITVNVEDEQFLILQGDLNITCKEIPKPVIVGHDELAFDMNTHFVMQMDYLYVEDELFDYPEDFGMTLYEGENYDFAHHTIYPHEGFSGEIYVPVSVFNEYKESEKHEVNIDIKHVTAVFSKDRDILNLFYSGQKQGFILVLDDTSYHFEKLLIYDVSGQLLRDYSVYGEERRQFFPAGDLKHGVYVYRLVGRKLYSGKVVVF